MIQINSVQHHHELYDIWISGQLAAAARERAADGRKPGRHRVNLISKKERGERGQRHNRKKKKKKKEEIQQNRRSSNKRPDRDGEKEARREQSKEFKIK